jgi:signal transduction histidine kinase
LKKNLLNKTLRPQLIFALAVLATSVPAYLYLVDSIWLRELDEHNTILAERTENEMNRLQLTEAELSQSIALWNKLQPVTTLKKAADKTIYADSTYTILRQDPYTEHNSSDRFRGLKRLIHIHDQPYYLTVETNVEETEETAAAIAAMTLLFFLILVAGLLILNRRLSARLWQPFRDTLSRLKTFKLNSQTPIAFGPSEILEFEELNETLRKLIEQNISVYRTQKEFTENASHELQTPLAIIKNKLDLLLQKETVTGRQYQIIEEINRALTRMTRINKNLLLLAKIENHQFDDHETVHLSQLTRQCLEQLEEHAHHKNIAIQTGITPDLIMVGNKTLIEILLNNLLLNAIRHTRQNGTMTLSLSKKELSITNSGNTALNPSALFQRFSKVSPESAGSGLGLAIIKQICDRHHWTIGYQFSDNTHCFSVRF